MPFPAFSTHPEYSQNIQDQGLGFRVWVRTVILHHRQEAVSERRLQSGQVADEGMH